MGGSRGADDPERAKKLAGQAPHLAADTAVDVGHLARGPALKASNAVLSGLGMDLVPTPAPAALAGNQAIALLPAAEAEPVQA